MSFQIPEQGQDLPVSIDKTNIKQILNTFSMFLRYIASGFIGLMVYLFLFWDDIKDLKVPPILENIWFLLILAASLGLITYSVHKAYLDVQLHAHHLKALLRKKNFHVTESFKNYMLLGYRCFSSGENLSYDDLIKSRMKIRFSCKSQSFLRGISTEKNIRRLELQLNERYAFLAFVYCAFYQSTLVLLYFFAVKFIVERQIYSIEVLKFILTAAIVSFVFYCAYKFDRKICKREIWVISEFGQDYPEK